MKTLGYSLAYLLPLTAAIGLQQGGGWSFMTVGVVYLAIPLFDHLLGMDSTRHSSDSTRTSDLLLYAALPAQLGLLALFIAAWSGAASAWERIGWIVSVGLSNGGLGITVAHELIHRRDAGDRWVGKALLATVGYMHFAIEHPRGHHQRVATDEDHASARLNESIFAFFWRSIFGQFGSAWDLERQRLAKRGLSAFTVRNEMLWFAAIQGGLWVTVAALFGGSVAWALLAVAAVAVMLLEVVNYVEHYGLRRTIDSRGRWEPVGPQHSWNSDHRLSRAMLFELPRHTDHHMNAGRAYPTLQNVNHAPQLPAGYPAMVLVALVPPLWFRLMNPRVAAVSQKN